MSPQPVMPPMQPGGMQMPEQRSAWPTVIGIIAIVLGSLGILGGCWGLATPWFLGVIKDIVPPGQATGMEFVEEWRAWTVINSLVGTGVAILLLFAGIGLRRCRRWAVPTCVTWAVVKMLFVVVNSVLMYMIQRPGLEAMAQQNPGMSGMGSGFLVLIGIISVVFGILWGWAFPVFLLVWLSRAKIKAETAAWL